MHYRPFSIRENQNTQQQSKTTRTSLPPNLKNIPDCLQSFCNLIFPKNSTCPSGKLRTKITSPIAKSTLPGLSDTTFFARCLTVHTCDVMGLPESGWSVLNLSASRLFSLQKVATQFTSCSPNRSHCLSETPSIFKSASMVDGLQLSQSLTIQFPQQKQNQQIERQTNEQRKQTKKNSNKLEPKKWTSCRKNLLSGLKQRFLCLL